MRNLPDGIGRTERCATEGDRQCELAVSSARPNSERWVVGGDGAFGPSAPDTNANATIRRLSAKAAPGECDVRRGLNHEEMPWSRLKRFTKRLSQDS